MEGKRMKQTEIGLIPDDWEVKKTGLLLKIGHGKDYKKLKTGDVPVFGTGGYMTSVDSFLYDGETVCIGRKGTIDKPFYHEGKIWTVDTLFYTYDFVNCIPKYIYYSFCLVDWLSMNEASGVPSLTSKNIEAIEISLPSTLAEQQRIAKALSDVDAVISTIELLIQKKKNIKQGTMQQLLTGKKRLPGFVTTSKFKQTEIGEIPEDWDIKKMGDLGTFKNGINKDADNFGFGSPFINLLDIFGKTHIDMDTQLGLINSSPYEQKIYSLNDGDVLFVRSSVKPEGVGLTTVIKEDLPNTVYSGFILRFRESKNLLTTSFKEYVFYNETFRQALISSSTISANTNINQASLRELYLSFPTSKEEQTAIANVLSSMDKEIETLNTKLEKYRNLKTAMMQQLLTGKIRLSTSKTAETEKQSKATEKVTEKVTEKGEK